MLLVLPDTTSWYWPVLEAPSFLTLFRPDLAVSQELDAYDPWEKLVCDWVVLRPRAITVDWSWISFVVRRLLLTVEADSVEADSVEAERVEADSVEAERVEADNVEAERVEAERVEADSVETVTVEAVTVEAETDPRARELV